MGFDRLPVVNGGSVVIRPTPIVADMGLLSSGVAVQCLLWLAAEDLAAGGGHLLLNKD